MRAAIMYIYVIKGFYRRLVHDLARELTVAIASAVVLATFAYVFDDFLNAEVAAVSPAMRDSFARALVPLLLGLATSTGAAWGRKAARGDSTYSAWALRSGETSGSAQALDFLVVATLNLAVHGVAWWIIATRLVLPNGALVVGPILGGVSIVVSLAPWRGERGTKAQNLKMLVTAQGGAEDAVKALSAWRMGLLTRRLIAARVPFVAALLLLLPAAFAAFRGLPVFVAGASALAAGVATATALAFQLAEDLRHPWQERGAGVSHDQFIAAWERVAVQIAAAVAVVAIILCLGGWALGSSVHGIATPHVPGTLPWPLVEGTLKVAVLAALPVVCMPWLMLQIDGRRPGIVMVPLALVAAFVGTAVLASWLGLLLLPLLRYYALRTQAGRFYRA